MSTQKMSLTQVVRDKRDAVKSKNKNTSSEVKRCEKREKIDCLSHKRQKNEGKSKKT